MYKLVIASLCLVALAAAAPAEKDVIPIVSHEATVDHDGHFHYSYESADGTKAEQSGELKVFDKEHAGEVVSGSNSFKSDDGKVYSTSYTADEFGYHPVGDHLPIAPPIPAAIVRALEYIAAHPSKDLN